METENLIISSEATIKEAITTLNGISLKVYQTLFIVDQANKLLGTLTDGDIRRGLLNGFTLEQNVSNIYNTQFKFLRLGQLTKDKIKEVQKSQIELFPILNDEGILIEVLDTSKKLTFLPIDAVIMAGGEGRRLRPLTENTPKPLLKVGGIPIIERNIDRLSKYGLKNITISINYLGDQLVEHFNDGSSKKLNIQYVREKQFLGTIGSSSLIETFENDTVLIMNSDLLTNIDYEDMYNEFMAQDADLIVASIPYNVSIPYAVLETKDGKISGLKEKPTYTYYSNAGIYMVKRSLMDIIPKNEKYDATDLIEDLIKKSKKVIPYSITSYWLDIGKHEDFEKAQIDIKHIKFD